MFRFQYEYTLEDMNALSRVSARTYRRKKVLVYRTVLALLGAVYLGMGVLLFSHQSWVAGTVLLIAGLLFAAISVFYHQGTAWRTKRMMVEGEGGFTVTLEEEGVHGKSEKGESSYPYSAVIGAYHYRERYFLFLDKRHAMLLPERALVMGDPSLLQSWLEQKLKRDIQKL